MTEFTSDMKTLIEDAKEKMDENAKALEERMEERMANYTVPQTQVNPTQARPPTNSYALALINPPVHANPRIAAREGIKARQFLIEGIRNSRFSHYDSAQLKTELNDIVTGLGLSTGRIRSVTNSRNGGTIIEADSDKAANWLSSNANQRRLCDTIGSNAEFRSRSFKIIAFNVPLAINPEDSNHRQEICEANNMEASTIISAKWAKAIDRRSPNQERPTY